MRISPPILPSAAASPSSPKDTAGNRPPARPMGRPNPKSKIQNPRRAAPIQNPKSKIGKVTSADVLEALHQATGMPVVADFYTRLYSPERLSVTDQPIFEALNQLAPTMRLRWNKEAITATTLTQGNGTVRPPAPGWLQFRSAGYYDDRLKEVPNRLL